MQKPPIPSNEAARIETLHALNILDTQPDERFDRLARMAKRLFDVPIALVSLVDTNRQWFKSKIGLDASETPRDISFCGHAILGDNIFIIPDTLDDKRFADNPLVTSPPNIRFYAGCPLKTPDGMKVGTLCIIDKVARHFSSDDLLALTDLANMVERELAALLLAVVDELTNISNRRGFITQAAHVLKFSGRNKQSASLIFMDLNNFKNLNDSFGHEAGDQALVAFANLMKNTFRDSDIYARLGGDEFVVFLPDTSIKAAEELVRRFNHALESHNDVNKLGFNLSFSHGIVLFDPQTHATIEDLMSEGDKLMYLHKKRAK